MSIAIGLVSIAFLLVLFAVRISALVGRNGAVQGTVPGPRQALAYRNRLQRKLHVRG